MPRKRSKAFWNNFKFKYKLTIINENTLEEIVGLRVSKLNGLSVLLSVLAVLFLIAACIIAFTPLRNYLPGYMNSEVRSQIVDNALRVDSLQELLNRQNLYILYVHDVEVLPVEQFLAGTAQQAEPLHHEHTGYFQRKSAHRQRADARLADRRPRRHPDGTYQT